MATFCATLAADVLRNCTSKAQSGLEQKVVLIPTSLAVVFTYDSTNPNELITDITLPSATSGLLIEGVRDKFWINHNNSFVNPDDGLPGYVHMIEGIRILTNSVAARKAVNDLTTGGNSYYVVVPARWKGESGAAKYRLLGNMHGLTVPDGGVIDNSNENDGAIVVTMQTPAGMREDYLPHLVLETNEATTDTAFAAKFATA
jgi:hypothetical protein